MRRVSRHPVLVMMCMTAVVACGVVIAADKDDAAAAVTATPKSAKAKAARTKFDAAMRKADEDWKQAATAAHRAYLKDVEVALKLAGTSGDAAETAAVAAEVERAKRALADLDRRQRPAKAVRSGRVFAVKPWQPVMRVKKGQRLLITAAGKWSIAADVSSGPDGAELQYRGRPFGQLLARVGEEVFAVGSMAEITVPADGVMEMFCNDGLDGAHDNAGHVDVTIEVQ